MTNKNLALYGLFVAAFCALMLFLILTEKDSFMKDCLEAGYRQPSCDLMFENGPPRMVVPRP